MVRLARSHNKSAFKQLGTPNRRYRPQFDALEDRTMLNGDFGFAAGVGGTGDEVANTIALDSAGNSYTTGHFQNTADFDPGPGVFNLTAVGVLDLYVLKLDAQGQFVWVATLAGVSGNALAVDDNGYVFVATDYSGTKDFDPSPGVYELTAVSNTDVAIVKLDLNGNFVWARSLGGTSGDHVNALAVDAEGSVYSTGSFQATIDLDPGTGVYNWTSVGAQDVWVSKLDADGDFVWAGGAGGNVTDIAESIAVDVHGNVYFSGEFQNTADFDPGTGVANLTNGGGYDFFVCKWDSDRNFEWAHGIGSAATSSDYAYDVTLDSEANVLVTGIFMGTVDFDPGSGVFNMTSGPTTTAGYVLKLDTNGNFGWACSLGNSTYPGSGREIACDAADDIYVTGEYIGTIDFDPGAGTSNLTSEGGFDIFVWNLDSNGNFGWVQGVGGNLHDYGFGIAVDQQKNVVTTGEFQQTVDFDPGTGVFNLTAVGMPDIFILQLTQIVPPTDLDLNNASVEENKSVNTHIGQFTTTDADSVEPFTYELISGVGSTHNALFTIVGRNLRTNAVFDYEAGSTYSIRVRTTDELGNIHAEPFTITITNANDAPVLDPIGPQAGDELTNIGFTVTASDQDASDTLAYTISGGLQVGMALDPDTGAFSWTPTELKDGVHFITIRATDLLGDFDEQTVQITVAEVNSNPTLTQPGDEVLNEQTTLSLVLSATDPDVIAGVPDNVQYFITVGQVGMTLDPDTGAFSWTPTETQDSVFNVRVQVVDASSAFEERPFQITVNEVNTNPNLADPGDANVGEGADVFFDLDAPDPDVVLGVPDTVTYAIVSGFQTGMNIDPATGVFTWTPDETQDGVFSVVFGATDNHAAGSTQTVEITVTEQNAQPQLVIEPTIITDTAITFQATGTDADSVAGDPNGLTYSLVGAPAGATIDNTGAFNWIPAAGQLGVFPFQVVVNDNTGAGNATATQNVTIRTLGVESGNLIVVGTAGKDAIKIKRGPDVYVPHDMTPTVQVLFNKQLVGTFGLTQGLGVNGGLIAYGLGGADALHAPLSTRRTYLFGGAGDDKVRGGNGPNVLVGGDGDDKLSGGALRDLLIGGLGADKLSGKKGDDILIGGSTGHVTKLLKLVEVMSEWDDSLTDVATRIGHLDGSLPGGSNNGTFLTTTTVLDDDAKDTLVGAGDTDWYFATLAGSTPDLVKGAKPGEEVTPLA